MQVARVDRARPRHGASLGARGGRDALVRNECRRGRGGHARRGRGGRLVSRRRPPGHAGTWSCMADRARRTRRLTAAGVLGVLPGRGRSRRPPRPEPVTLTVSPVRAGRPRNAPSGSPPGLGWPRARGSASRGEALRVADCLRSPCVATYRGARLGSRPLPSLGGRRRESACRLAHARRWRRRWAAARAGPEQDRRTVRGRARPHERDDRLHRDGSDGDDRSGGLA